MRRFEYKDEKSSKFWQIGQEGGVLTLLWGRIGTKGQSQNKEFADAAQALAAMNKLIKEKTGKGYLEVSDTLQSSQSSQSRPEPSCAANSHPVTEHASTPASIVTIPDEQPDTMAVISSITLENPPAKDSTTSARAPWFLPADALVFPEALMSQRLCSRRHPAPSVELDARASWMNIRKQLLLPGYIRIDLERTSYELRADFEAALRRLEEDQIDGDLATDTVLFALCGLLKPDDRGIGYSDITDYLVAHKGLSYATDVLLQAQTMVAHHEWDRYSREFNCFLMRYESASFPPGPRYSAAEVSLRTLLSRAEESEWLLCRDKLQAALPQLPPKLQPLIALLLPECPELANTLVQLGHSNNHIDSSLLLVASSEEALASIIESGVSTGLLHQDYAKATLIAERGEDAVPLLALNMDASHEVLVSFGTPEAIVALASAAGQSKSVAASFSKAITRWPLAAIAALAQLLAHSNKKQELLATSLTQLLRSQARRLDEVMPWISIEGQGVIKALLASEPTTGEVAEESELPGVLVAPPWLGKKKKAAVALTLDLLPLSPIMDWPDAERKQAMAFDDLDSWRRERAAADPDVLIEQLGFRYRDPKVESLREALRVAVCNQDSVAFLQLWQQVLEQQSFLVLDLKFTADMDDEMALGLWSGLASIPYRRSSYMLARFGLVALPGLITACQVRPATEIKKALHFGAAELAPIMARAYQKLKTVRESALLWLLRYPEHAIAGLLPAALGKRTEAQGAAVAALRLLSAHGHDDLIMQVAARYERAEVSEAVRHQLDEDPLDLYPGKIAPAPEFWQPTAWRRPRLKGSNKLLPESALTHLGTMLRFPVTDGLYEGINQVKAACDGESLADFVWDCFAAWQLASGSAKDNWAFICLGYLGTDETARKLTPYIRAWPGESQHQRAVAGLDVLGQIGSDVALMLLNGIAQKVKFKGLQERAKEKIAAIAAARELSLEELEDRLAPDLGLDEQGSLLLDFGPRQFRVGFDESLKPFVKDGNGQRVKDLPKPNKGDDEVKALAAVEQYKRLKKDAKMATGQQLIRLEQAMCQRRRWTPEQFMQLLVWHPLLRHLVQRLVWALYCVDEGHNYGGQVISCFRVAEDGSLTTGCDDPFTLPTGDNIRVGIPHVLEFSDEQSSAFSQLFADYELLQPFVQLGRDSYLLTDEERQGKALTRWAGKVVPTGRILGLASKGWARGEPQDAGAILEFIKPVSGRLGAAIGLDPGVFVGAINEFPEQTLGPVVLQDRSTAWYHEMPFEPFTQLDEITLSELVRDMEALCS